MTRKLAATGAVMALLLIGAWLVFLASATPSTQRSWAPEHARPATVEIQGGRVWIRDLRDFLHSSDGAWETRYTAGVFDASDARAVWFVLAPFADRFRGLAHSFLSFEFEGGRFVAVSVEARREQDESYGLVGGLLRAYELTYVVGTERDLIGQRAIRGDSLFLYPSVATPEQAGALFLDVMQRARELEVRPEFYNTLTNNCTTNLRDHVNRLIPQRLPWGWGVLLPGYSDALALEHRLLRTRLGLEQARRRFTISSKARTALGSGGSFGSRIREGMASVP